MKILVVSDSHKDTETVLKLAEMYPNMDLYLHAGDSEDCSSNLYPFQSVQGNCDFYDFDEKRYIRLENCNLLMKHYPNLRKEEAEDISIFIHGHTHIYSVKKEERIIRICPGSIAYSRDSSKGSYAIIDIENQKINIKIYSLETKKVLLNDSYNIK